MAVTEFDAFEDATDYGRCGLSAPVGDIEGMADVYYSLCSNEDRLRDMCVHAFEYSEKVFPMEKIVARIHDSLSGVV